jgi:cell division protein FtsB
MMYVTKAGIFQSATNMPISDSPLKGAGTMQKMHRRVSIVPVVAILGALLVVFFWLSSRIAGDINEVGDQYQQAVAVNTTLETQQNDLKTTLASVNSDAFIEKQARALYDYMKPDELRLVITNPDALYGTDGR